MGASRSSIRFAWPAIVALAAASISVAGQAAAQVQSKRGPFERRVGIIHRLPNNGLGFWQVGSFMIEADNSTEIYARATRLAIGECVVVDLRGSRATRITGVDLSVCSSARRDGG